MFQKPLSISHTHSPDQEQTDWLEYMGGSEGAYEKLYNKYVDELYRYGYMLVRNRLLVEDAIHDVFTDLWSNRASISKVNSVRLYLFASVKRRLLRKVRKERTFLLTGDDQQSFPFEAVPSFLDEQIEVAEKDLFSERLKKCLNSLSSRQREIIYLRFFQNMTYLQIASLLELDQKYVYNLASKAFCSLRLQVSSLVTKVGLK